MIEDTLNQKYFAVFAASALVFTGALAVSGNVFESPLSSDSEDDLQWRNEITIEKNGNEIAHFTNTLTDQGKNWIRSQISTKDDIGADSDELQYISVGNGSTVQSGDTVLNKEVQCCGLERTSGSLTSYNAGEFAVENTFTATADVGTVNTTGLNYGSTQGGTSLVSGGAFSADANLLTDDQLTVTHNITISEGS